MAIADRHHAAVVQLCEWAEAGWLRWLDVALAQWCVRADPGCDRRLPYVVALLAALEGRGHACLPLQQIDLQLQAWLGDAAADPVAASPLTIGTRAQALVQWRRQLPDDAADWQAVLDSPLVQGYDPLAPDTCDTAADEEAPPLVVHWGGQGTTRQPVRLYLRRYHRYERTVATGLLQRVAPLAEAATAALPASRIAAVLDALFGGTPAAASQTSQTPNWQKVACALALRQRLAVITGGPGTGKTYTVARLLAAVLALAPKPHALRIQLAAPTGKAAARLSESLQQSLHALPPAITALDGVQAALAAIPAARTLHALLGAQQGTRRLRHDAANPLQVDWLVVDEASMVDLQMMAALLAALPPQAHLVLLGDKDQLDSVEAGAVLGDVCAQAEAGRYAPATAAYVAAATREQLPAHWQQADAPPPLAQATVMLRESRRFGGPIGALAAAVRQGDDAAMQGILRALAETPAAEREVFWKEGATLADARRIVSAGAADAGATAADGYAPLMALLARPPRWPGAGAADAAWLAAHDGWVQAVLAALARFRILCATRAGDWGVDGMNALVLQALRAQGVPVRASGWFAGRVVMVVRNDASLGVFNGDVGVALPSAQDRQRLRVYFPQPGAQAGASRSVSVSRLQHVETAFAMTVHKSQGSEFEHVLLCLPAQASPLLTRELLYTGLTRARRHFSYLAPEPGMWQQAMAQRTRRASGLAEQLALQPAAEVAERLR
ncbi:hypothetical protein AAV94_07975 [Lampropedia cohaerens]|uniref:RecBCD enzyme subunit RecD n=1 Tax=Lampropedia cohaerens TaxID=1610491 RepID=A0A0U1PZG3_9BURK|nr:hypothetical protein AAV94_07975 [Lampropedia cohaerens]